MLGASIKEQLTNFIRSLNERGLLDHHFDLALELQTEENPQFVSELISMFCRDAEVSIAELTTLLDQPLVDYTKAITFVHQLKGSSSSIGGCRMTLASGELRQASDKRNKERCIEALYKVKQEYQILKENLSIIAQMQNAIQANERSKRP
ncbi:putative Histidine-containing phosphotransfer protein [Tripterygium wilfordii]|uniref:Histidine-containing phosphotransfer protein n=1 Tax=Tripterygium wilfordii TaxID=458696 RepID=A0A7J7C094_TRIWF|nr:histidine-containing phosphotransfer protein 2-like isoform X2 [Tripterygium wilfordii]KAF5727518.1 putative Histidine-containing phosphotransfer protein [Tripterygium wilfordii]